tara:strand:- start:38092 stop:38670 length:579 start_codon:yes stop_codon:yes gene_type:complete
MSPFFSNPKKQPTPEDLSKNWNDAPPEVKAKFLQKIDVKQEWYEQYKDEINEVVDSYFQEKAYYDLSGLAKLNPRNYAYNIYSGAKRAIGIKSEKELKRRIEMKMLEADDKPERKKAYYGIGAVFVISFLTILIGVAFREARYQDDGDFDDLSPPETSAPDNNGDTWYIAGYLAIALLVVSIIALGALISRQ